MTAPLLLTSFSTWLPHQGSNSSDDLVAAIAELSTLKIPLVCLRKLPVNTLKASEMVIQKIQDIQPQAIICCGMAEGRSVLTVESRATQAGKLIYTSVYLEEVLDGTLEAQMSHDAGKFVCEGLYFSVLNYLQQNSLKIPCVFVHVPLLTVENFPVLFQEFQKIMINLVANTEIS